MMMRVGIRLSWAGLAVALCAFVTRCRPSSSKQEGRTYGGTSDDWGHAVALTSDR